MHHGRKPAVPFGGASASGGLQSYYYRAAAKRAAEFSDGLLHLTVHGDFMNHSDLLVVDDDDATRTGLRQLLANAGFTVDVAQDGAEAMEKISSHDFRVVLLDVR